MKGIIESARQTVGKEISALQSIVISDNFQRAVELIHLSGGRLVISGVGKSAIIAQKITATLNSTGTPALFMHAADAIHGDLGMLQVNDVSLLISKSGESNEVKVLIPLIKNLGNKIVTICGNVNSYLAKNSDIFIDATVSEEACPNNLAPTSSTTVQMVLGDALAVALLELKGFTAEDFAKFHPGGSLGKQMYLRVDDLISLHQKPVVEPSGSVQDVIVEMTSKRLGATVVADHEKVLGIITDGDIRRMLEKYDDWNILKAEQIMTVSPKVIESGTLAVEALRLMQQYNISQLIVVENEKYMGLFHIHDLIKEGLV